MTEPNEGYDWLAWLLIIGGHVLAVIVAIAVVLLYWPLVRYSWRYWTQ